MTSSKRQNRGPWSPKILSKWFNGIANVYSETIMEISSSNFTVIRQLTLSDICLTKWTQKLSANDAKWLARME